MVEQRRIVYIKYVGKEIEIEDRIIFSIINNNISYSSTDNYFLKLDPTDFVKGKLLIGNSPKDIIYNLADRLNQILSKKENDLIKRNPKHLRELEETEEKIKIYMIQCGRVLDKLLDDIQYKEYANEIIGNLYENIKLY